MFAVVLFAAAAAAAVQLAPSPRLRTAFRHRPGLAAFSSADCSAVPLHGQGLGHHSLRRCVFVGPITGQAIINQSTPRNLSPTSDTTCPMSLESSRNTTSLLCCRASCSGSLVEFLVLVSK